MREVMMRVRADRRQLLIVSALALAVAAVSVIPLWRLTAPNVPSDIILHVQLAKIYVESGNIFTYSLWYPLIWLATGGGDLAIFRIPAIVLLTVFVVLKAIVAYLIAQDFRQHAISSAVIAFGVTFFGPLVDPSSPRDIYLGQLSPTVWHNSTNIMAAPFALVAFWAAIRLLKRPTWQTAVVAGIACTLSVLVKPNFAVALIPVIGVILIVTLSRERVPARAGIVIVAAAALPPLVTLVAQYAAIYGGGVQRAEKLTIAPFAVWTEFSSNIPLSLVLSLLGVGAALVILAVRRAVTPALGVAWLVLIVAIVQAIVLAEKFPDGQIALSGNWFWGSYTALMVIVLWSAAGLREQFAAGVDRPRAKILPVVGFVVLALHVISGLYYALVVGTAAYGGF